MSIEQCENTACLHYYELIEFGSGRPAPSITRSISCPYCGHTMQRHSRGAFVTAPCDQQRVVGSEASEMPAGNQV